MNKKVLRAGAVSAVAAGIGAAAVMAGKRRSKKEEENSDSVSYTHLTLPTNRLV